MKKIALVLKGYPRLSETFIAQEIQVLETRGLDILIVSLRHPTDKKTHPVHEKINAAVHYLPEYLHQEPLRVLKSWWIARRQTGYREARSIWLADLKRDRSRNRIRRFGQALVLAAEIPQEITQLYAHFLHTPASVTRYAAITRDLPWSCSAHAKDIWTSPEWELKEKLASLRWLSTCTEANYHYLRSLSTHPERVHLVYHGLDLERFKAPEKININQHDGSDSTQPVRIVSVGRAVPKKGYDDILEALACLPKTLHWKFTHIGGGALLNTLKQQAERLGIGQHIQWLGAMEQTDVLQAYRQSDLFILASKIVEDGDRDGLPNVLMEAQSQGLCCLATNISGIPELLEDNITGRMVEPASPAQLSEALRTLITQPTQRNTMAKAGMEKIHTQFGVDKGIDQLMELF